MHYVLCIRILFQLDSEQTALDTTLMAIHFTCTQCGKPLFAQEQYAGRPVTCPACQTRNTIPQPDPQQAPQPLMGLECETTFVPGKVQTPSAVAPLVEGDPELLDMEKPPAPPMAPPAPPMPPLVPVAASSTAPAPAPLPLSAPAPDSSAPTTSTAAPASPSAPAATPAPSPDLDATRRCPMCAETIKAAARKCRFCGTLLDTDLRLEEDERRAMVATGVLAEAQRSATTWRAIAVLATGLTIGWLVFITARVFIESSELNVLMVFNPLLIIGLVWNSRQMRQGPAHVFFSAALAILLCMPLNFMLGLPTASPEMQQQFIKQNQANFKDMKPEDIAMMFKITVFFMYLAVDFVFSLPVWIAMMKVRALQRLQATLGKSK